MTAHVVVRDGVVTDFAQEVRACALGQASAAVLGGAVLGRTPAELAAAREAVATAEASVQAATVGSARRGAEKELRKAKKRLEKLESSAPAPVHPTKKVQKVTLTTGESYILLREEASPDVHTETWAQAVGQAIRKRLQGLIGLQVARAGLAIAQADTGHAKFERAEFRGVHARLRFSFFAPWPPCLQGRHAHGLWPLARLGQSKPSGLR